MKEQNSRACLPERVFEKKKKKLCASAWSDSKAALTRIWIDSDIRMSQLRIGLPSTRKRLKCTLSGAIPYAIRSNTLRYPELFENDFKGGSSGCLGALWRRVNGASGYPDVTAHALCGFLRLESVFFLLLSTSFKNFLSLFSCPVTAQSDFKVFLIASSILQAISHALTGPISSRSTPSNAVFYSR